MVRGKIRVVRHNIFLLVGRAVSPLTAALVVSNAFCFIMTARRGLRALPWWPYASSYGTIFEISLL